MTFYTKNDVFMQNDYRNIKSPSGFYKKAQGLFFSDGRKRYQEFKLSR